MNLMAQKRGCGRPDIPLDVPAVLSRARIRVCAKRQAKERPPKTAAKMAPRKAPRQGLPVIEDTIIDVIDEPVPGVVRVTEYETIRTMTPNGGAGPETEE